MEKENRPNPPKKSAKQKIIIVFFCLAVAGFIFSAGMLIYELIIVPGQNQQSVEDYQDLYSRPESQNQSASSLTSSSATSSQETSSQGAFSQETSSQEAEKPQILPEFLPLVQKNRDIAGWLTIPNTKINHPVFWTPHDQNYYLNRDANGNYNKLGSLFLSADSTLSPQAKVMVVYGHNMEDNDEMFGQLLNYKKLSFLKQNPTLTFDTCYQRGEWKVIAVCRGSTVAADLQEFPYHKTQYDEESLEAFIRNIRKRSLFRIDDSVCYEDSLVVFSTCEYAFWGDRLLVIARKLRENETAESVSTKQYQKNPVILMPDSYYALSYIKDKKPTWEMTESAYQEFYHTP